MAIGRRAAVPRQPDTPSDKANIPELTDAQLLERFVARRDEEAERAFGELLARHGPMVLGVCRRMLRDVHSADDAFQAAFLVLVRRAGSVRGESLGPWLHGVTYHVASRARALAARRRERDGVNIDQWEAPVDEPDRVELRAIVDEEVHRLPEAYRAAAVLCYLAGHTHEEAAVRLRCPVGTVKSRLSRARDLLRARLNRRGLALTAGVLTSALVAEAAPVAVPAKLAGSTTRAATRLAGGKAATEMGVSSSVAGAAEATLGDLISARLKVAGIVLLAAGVVATVAIRPGRHADGAGGPVAAARPVSAQAIGGTAEPVREADPGQAADDRGEESEVRIDARAPQAPAAEEVYRSDHKDVGRDPEAQIRLALWYEAHGRDAERLEHLTLATQADPNHATARGLMGQVAYRGDWRNPDAVAKVVGTDPALAAVLTEYTERRHETPDTADAHWKLALWCEQVGLRAESLAHFTAVTRLDPRREAAWRRLECQKSHGRWRTQAQVAAERAEAEARMQADRAWRRRLEEWRTWLTDEAMQAQAEVLLDGVTDPWAVPSVWAVFVIRDERSQARAARLLGQIDGPEASRALAVLAICGRSVAVRRVSGESLLRRDPRDFVGSLIGLLRDPIEYDVRSVGGRGSPGVLFVHGKPFSASGLLNRQVSAAPVGTMHQDERSWIVPGLSPIGQMLPDAPKPARTAREQLVRDIKFIDQYNVFLREHNASVVQMLCRFTEASSKLTHEDWAAWWAGELGDGFDPPGPAAVEEALSPSRPLSADHTDDDSSGDGASLPVLGCFGAGTPVRSFRGIRSIETLRLGDRVLAQDTTSGALDFQPILAVCQRPRSPTVRVDLEDDSIVVTAVHRFWRPGRGWVMARDLKAGDALRMRNGLARVVAVEPEPAQPVFNIEVANTSSFFAGRRGALVHDITPVEPIHRPFDARRSPEAPGGPSD